MVFHVNKALGKALAYQQISAAGVPSPKMGRYR